MTIQVMCILVLVKLSYWRLLRLHKMQWLLLLLLLLLLWLLDTVTMLLLRMLLLLIAGAK